MILLALLLLDLATPARELALKIIATAGSPDVSLAVRNLSSLAPGEVAEVRRTLESHTRKGSQEVRVTLGESLREYVWTAEVGREAVMVRVPRSESRAGPAAGVTIERRLIWEQETPILDAIEREGRVIVLEPSRIAVYRGREVEREIAVRRAPARDPRGMLRFDGDAIAEPSMPAGQLNHFGGHYSSAIVEDRGREVTLTMGIDGITRSSGGERWNGWGSDIAGIDNPCGGRLALATRPSAQDEPDAVQAYRIAEGQPAAEGAPVEFQGPVTALWGRGAWALAVARNLVTGRYAAYSLSATCSR